jgi:ADP-ribose pyrophosphatase YjhB (NUDIX family)
MLTCYFEDGDKALLRHLAVDGIVIRNNEVMLVKRAQHLLAGGKWAIPGGYMNRDETTRDVAIREVLEETGWKCNITGFFAVADSPNRGDDRQNISLFFLMEPIEEAAKPDDEVSEVRWFPLDSLPEMEDIAFDHGQVLEEYRKYHTEKGPIPVFID